MARAMHLIVGDMPDDMRRVYTLKKVYEMKNEQIAERLHMSLDDVETNLVAGIRFVAKAVFPGDGKPSEVESEPDEAQ